MFRKKKTHCRQSQSGLVQMKDFLRLVFCISMPYQGRREPNMGPGSAQILQISGFVKSKTNGQNATDLSGFWCDLQKKRSSVFHVLISQCHFDGPCAGPPQANGPHDGPPWSPWAPKVNEPWGHCPPCPPLLGLGPYYTPFFNENVFYAKRFRRMKAKSKYEKRPAVTCSKYFFTPDVMSIDDISRLSQFP